MNAKQFYQLVIVPALQTIGLDSIAARQLVIGSIWHESNKGEFLHQLGNGPACGVIQMEPATHADIWANYLQYKPELKKKVLSLVTQGEQAGHVDSVCTGSLIWNLAYQVAMCRIHYLRVPAALPEAGDIQAMANYWKQHYNTPLGAGKPEQFEGSFPVEVLAL
ncbi:hypothetical protein [Vibrio sp. V39_P1S14PM300]|uniref:hypothetical protein n=1 Tax=Vibrio sp. V39_P1S14PM300 TaxID=1938690 RepID=UPI0013737749|nr:hypothetical protein [Vibrio sp. V39_P1S14PM300]NAX21278.1 hypothetical protein [Vibrio sp. V39_P1S14PM300]